MIGYKPTLPHLVTDTAQGVKSVILAMLSRLLRRLLSPLIEIAGMRLLHILPLYRVIWYVVGVCLRRDERLICSCR